MSKSTKKPSARTTQYRRKAARFAHLHNFNPRFGKHEAILFRLGQGRGFTEKTAKASGDGRTAQVIISAQESITLPKLVTRIRQRHISGLQDGDVESVINALAKTVAEELRIGNSVCIKGFGSFHSSIEGRFAPTERALVPFCDVKPHFRPADEFTAGINQDACLVCEDDLEPTTVKIESVRVWPDRIGVYGNFHGDQRITAEAESEDGRVTACEVQPQKKAGSKRKVSKALLLVPAEALPAGKSVTVILKWTDGIGDPQEARTAALCVP